jgi:Zn-finger nucleic acid-binding protein
MTCPSCQAEMQTQVLEGHLGTSVTVDLCLACQMFWFDPQESLKLSPSATLKLFRLVGEHRQAPRPPSAGMYACPRCHGRLRVAHDIQRNTRFQYLRCPLGHGRLITFFEFLREKDFIRPLSAAQVEELRRNVQTVNCSNCGAPIDLAAGATCTHCGSALSMLDMQRAGALVDELQRAGETRRTIDPALPFELARARREVLDSFAEFERGPAWFGDVSSFGLVGAGLTAISRWLKDA